MITTTGRILGQDMVDKALAAGHYVRREVHDNGTVTVTVLREVRRTRMLRSEATAFLAGDLAGDLEAKGA